MFKKALGLSLILVLALGLWGGFLLPCFSQGTDKITVVTYYPSPFGVYNQLVTSTLGVGDNNVSGGIDSGDAPDPIANPGYLWVAGNVGIGTMSPQYKLDVIGNIRATGSVYYGGTEGNADGTAYSKPDFVFKDGYKVMKIEKVEQFLKKEGHLPWMTSVRQEKAENGNAVNMTRMSFETVETAENLQLQVIALNKSIKEQGDVIREQQRTITALKQKVAEIEAKLR